MPHSILYPVQYLRFAAAMAVFFYHISATIRGIFDDANITVDEIGAAGVDLFFVISGFVMAKVVWESERPAREFFIRRVLRIVPLYFTVTFLVFGIALVAPVLMGATTADPLQLLHSLFFLPYGMSEGSSAPTLNIGWTLNYEMFFYLCITLFIGFWNDRNLLKTSIFLLALTVLGLIWQPENRYAKFYTDPILLEFVFGVIVFRLWLMTKDVSANVLFGMLFGIALAVIAFQFNHKAGDARVLYWGLPSALLLFSGLNFLRFKSEWLRKLGDSSYAIYLLHLFVIMGVYKVFLPLLDFPMPWQFHYAIMTILLLASSLFVHYVIDRPITAALTNWVVGALQKQNKAG